MSRIGIIEQAIKLRLEDAIDNLHPLARSIKKQDGSTVEVPLAVESYPDKPTTSKLKSLASSGAVLVRYAGSRYNSAKSIGLKVQDRTMFFELIIVSDSLAADDAHSGCYGFLDTVGERLIGFRPEICTDGFEIVRDDFLEEHNGVWEYGMMASVKTEMVQPALTIEEAAVAAGDPLLKKVTPYNDD